VAPQDTMPYNGQGLPGACYFVSTMMPPSLAEHLSTPPPLPPIGTLNNADPEHHAPIMNGNYLLNIPYNEQMRVNWMNSVGHQFERLRDQGFFHFGNFQCIVTPHSSHKVAFYGGSTPVLHRPPSPTPDQVGHKF
jgi:hypothetical protein